MQHKFTLISFRRLILALAVSFRCAASSVRGGQQQQRGLQAGVGSVTRLSLINVDTNQEITALESGAVLNLATHPTTNLNVQAVTEGAVASVRFDYDGVTDYRTEWGSPYAFCGDSGGLFAHV